MDSEYKGAPAFIREHFFQEIRSLLPGKLEKTRRAFLKEWKFDIELPAPELVRTKPEGWPKSRTIVVYTRNTRAEAISAVPQGSIEAPRSIRPGQHPYASMMFVEYYCRGGSFVEEEDDMDPNTQPERLKGYEVLNIQCQNTLWAAYNVVLDIGRASSFLVEMDEGLTFDNTRGDNPQRFPLTEWGMFRFIVTV